MYCIKIKSNINYAFDVNAFVYSYCCIVDRDNKKSMQLDSIMFNSISNPIQKLIKIILMLFS